jgi:single-strand DNA-binding protein
MSRGINKVILLGNLGKDPEINYLESNKVPVVRFTLATSESYTNKEGQKVDQVEWHNVTLWRGLAEVAEKYLKKGSRIYLEGKIRNRSYEDKEGNKKYISEIVVDNMVMLDSRPEGSSGGYSGGGYASRGDSSGADSAHSQAGVPTQMAPQGAGSTEAYEDDLPF